MAWSWNVGHLWWVSFSCRLIRYLPKWHLSVMVSFDKFVEKMWSISTMGCFMWVLTNKIWSILIIFQRKQGLSFHANLCMKWQSFFSQKKWENWHKIVVAEDFRREISKVGSWWEFWYRPVKFMGKWFYFVNPGTMTSHGFWVSYF